LHHTRHQIGGKSAGSLFMRHQLAATIKYQTFLCSGTAVGGLVVRVEESHDAGCGLDA